MNPAEVLGSLEPVISAIVGLATLVAGLWGLIKFAWLPTRPSRAVDAAGGGQRTDGWFPAVWTALIDRGIESRMDLAQQVSVRSFNGCVVFLAVATLTWLVMTLRSPELLFLSLINFTAFFAAITAYNLHARGHFLIAKWLYLVGAFGCWGATIVLLGTGHGLEYFIGALSLLPLLLFDRDQRGQRNAALLLLLLVFGVSLLLQSYWRLQPPAAFERISESFYYVNAVVLALTACLALYFYNRSADESFLKLEDEEHKSQELIQRMVPAYVAEKLAAESRSLADWHVEASVLFATVNGFESLYQRVSALQLVELLAEVFTEFDAILEARGIEKVNTLGTHYVAASGIDPRRRTCHDDLLRAALGMRDVVRRLSATVDHPFSISVGIATGELLSGVIGTERPTFDVWGKTAENADTLRRRVGADSIAVNAAAFWRSKRQFLFESAGDGEEYFLLLGEKGYPGP